MYIPNKYSDFKTTCLNILDIENESTKPSKGKNIDPKAIGTE